MPARLISPFKIRCLFISMILLIWNIESVIAVEPVYVWEVVSTYRRRLNEGRIQLLPDGKTDAGIDWEIKGNKIDFGTEGEAEPRINGAFFKGNWIGGWHLNARVLMSHTSLETEPGTAVEIPAEGGQSLVGTKFSKDLEKSIYDLWEFLAFKRGTNQFIHLTCLLTPDRQILDGTRRIGTYELMRGKIVAKFLDAKFQEIEFKLQRNGSLASRIKADDGKYWDLVFTRVQRQAVFQTEDGDQYTFFTNHRVNSPVYTEDYWKTFNWYFYTESGKRRLAIRSRDATLTPNGRGITWGDEKMILVEGLPLR